jgi:hypothetical protein
MKTCPKCGNTKELKQFYNRWRKVEEICTVCRQKEQRRRKRKRVESTAHKLEVTRAKKIARTLVDKNPIHATLRQIRKDSTAARVKARAYEAKLAEGRGSTRTQGAFELQSRKVRYFEDLERIVLRHGRLGVCLPYLAYRTNTKILARHGFPVAVDHNDPDW